MFIQFIWHGEYQYATAHSKISNSTLDSQTKLYIISSGGSRWVLLKLLVVLFLGYYWLVIIGVSIGTISGLVFGVESSIAAQV